jgi:hypothetical protein
MLQTSWSSSSFVPFVGGKFWNLLSVAGVVHGELFVHRWFSLIYFPCLLTAALLAARRCPYPIKVLFSTNNIARGMVRGSQVRFQSTKNTFSIQIEKNRVFPSIDG